MSAHEEYYQANKERWNQRILVHKDSSFYDLAGFKAHGLVLRHFNEFMYSPYPGFNHCVPAGEDRWRIKGMEGKLPMVYSVRAIKQ